jgi:hypothetical protein
MGFQKGNTMGQGRAEDLTGKPSINVEGKNQYKVKTTKEIQAIIDANPDYMTPKNFYQPTDKMEKKGMKKLLTLTDTENPDVIFQKKGKDPADPEKQTARNTKRNESILRQEGRNYNVKAPKGYQIHHMLPLAGNVDINTGDLAVISKEMNAKMSKYDKIINKLTTEASLLDFSKKNSLNRLDDINEQLNSVLKTIKKDLPKKYKGLIGFNKLTPVFDEYGTVLNLTAKPVGIDYKKSIQGSKGVPTRDVKTSDIQKLVNEAPKSDLKNLMKSLENDLLKLAGTTNKKCKGLLAYGGRVALAEGLSPDFCIGEGRKIAADLAKKKIQGTLAQKSIMGRITSGVIDFAKGILNPEELFDVKKQLFSKAALASFPIFDVLDALDDVGRKGISFKEAFANTLTFGTLPQSLGLTKNMDVLNAEKMLNDPDLSPAGKEYAQYLMDVDQYKKLKSTPSASHPNVKEKIKELEEKIINTKMTGESDYLSALSNTLDKETSGRYVGEANKIMPGYEVAYDGKDVRKVNEYGYATKGASYDAADKTGAPSFFSGELKKAYADIEQKPGQLPTTGTKLVPAYVSQNYKTMKEAPLNLKEINVLTDYERKRGLLKPNQNLDEVFYNNVRFKKNNEGMSTLHKIKGLSPLGEYENLKKWEQAINQPGIKGTQDRFATGGLAGLMEKYNDKR